MGVDFEMGELCNELSYVIDGIENVDDEVDF